MVFIRKILIMIKILILLKESSNYGDYGSITKIKTKTGLYNSARLVVVALNKVDGLEAELITCVDGNDIDSKLHKHKPNICIIEAIWVSPSKLIELQNKYPLIRFVVRVHSKIPFLAMEGAAIGMIKEYIKIPNVDVSFNNHCTSKDLNSICIPNIFLPNIYEEVFDFCPSNKKEKAERNRSGVYNIGCFGAIRPLKNQLNQAVAAIKFGEVYGVCVNFYVNSVRLEQGGESVLKNMKALFKDTNHTLIEVGWLDRPDFLELLSTMDISMQVSLTESFNIVAADSVFVGVPLVISNEIDWLKNGISDPNDVDSMVKQIKAALNYKNLFITQNLIALKKYNTKSKAEWILRMFNLGKN